tara:strand:+ start:621 stop:1271 length:651 start_codon:yes stop_codon:yes gene_type:complete
MTEYWETRRSAREFTDKEVDFKIIQDIVSIIPAIPSQNAVVDHWWVVLGPDDSKYKEWLVDNVYYTQEKFVPYVKEYFIGLVTAPYVFHSFKITPTPRYDWSMYVRNNAFHAGVIVSQAIDKGLDAAPIACREGWADTERQEYRDIIWERFEPVFKNNSHTYNGKVYNWNIDTIFEPMMCVGVGHGKPYEGVKVKKYKDGITKCSKPKKTTGNVSL